jgi:hypothetical protein
VATKNLSARLQALESNDGGKWRVYAIPLYDDETHEEAISTYEEERGPLEHGPKVLKVLLRQFRNRGE